MKAILYAKYGPPGVLELRELPKPTPKDNEILVKIHATTVTSGDARLRSLNVPTGFRLITRIAFGFTGPRKPILGIELAGIVEGVGKDVTRFKEGDQVFGASDKMSCYAEYVALPENGPLDLKPSALTYEEAAAIPFGALSSLVYLRDFGKIKAGQQILINGASGALGVYAVQLAKHFGADITAVCSGANVGLVQSLGADKVIDYTKEDFAKSGKIYDIIFDTVGKISFSRCKNLLSDNGRCLLAVAGLPDFGQVLWTSIRKKKVVAGVAAFKKDDLVFFKELIAAGKLRPVIDRRYPLEQIVDAHRYVDKGHKKGAVVITLEQKNQSSGL